ncbi:MAG: DNA-directed RNA polymerase subunit P [Candidatus Aenigmarchaeota archaeon]|nr:DNA-directed RNA polymerase subunit P [Candidatus Aenigmarchaeota archaeon]
MYKCLKCDKEIESIKNRILCPFCGFRIAVKIRSKQPTKVNAI